MWSKRERIGAVLHGERADRPPISAWRHFPQFEHDGPAVMAKAMLDFQSRYDWDFIKVNPRAVYYHEAWGNKYDYDHYNDVVPTLVKKVVNSREDIEKIGEVSGRNGVFAEQIEAVRLIIEGTKGKVPVFQTIFTPVGIFMNLCGLRSIGRYRESPREESVMIQMMNEEPHLVHVALGNIARTIANYAAGIVEAGADGVFYAALGMARTGYFTPEEWQEFVKPYDLMVLEELKKIMTIIHTCGIHSNPEWFTGFPVNVIHWAENAPGNPSLVSAPLWIKNRIPMGGVDERLFGANKPEEIRSMAKDTIEKMDDIPFILAPDCSIGLNSSDEEIAAFRSSVEGLPDELRTK